jgi:hypothetical protein
MNDYQAIRIVSLHYICIIYNEQNLVMNPNDVSGVCNFGKLQHEVSQHDRIKLEKRTIPNLF